MPLSSILYIGLVLIMIIIIITQEANASNIVMKDTLISGKVVDAQTGQPLAGATVRLKNKTIGTQTDASGKFQLSISNEDISILISYIGYQSKEVSLTEASKPLVISLQRIDSTLKAVVVSTGYQSLPEERATGSFDKISHQLFNREVSTDVLSRLEGKASGILFDKRTSDPQINIRGRSTLFANSKPLIILNDFPYEGNLNNINPNDVESITILKDAAAASIWGVRAANGVIVITTKQGGYHQPLSIDFNSNITIGNKPDIYYNPEFLNSADFIDVEEMLFKKGFYDRLVDRYDHPPLTPVIELLLREKNDELSHEAVQEQINALKALDVREDFEKYWYRKSIRQQYALSLQGGGDKANYYLSAGYDHNLSNLSAQYTRFSLRSDNHIKLLSNLQLRLGINLTKSENIAGKPTVGSINSGSGKNIYPYARLADKQGNPLTIVKDYSSRFVQEAEAQGLLNWKYKPLRDYKYVHNNQKLTDVVLNTGLKYIFSPSFNAVVKYQYEQQQNNGYILYNAESYFARNFVNRYTQVNADSTLERPVPEGGIKDISSGTLNSQALRGQLNFQHNWGSHRLVAITGVERREIKSTSNHSRVYGYDDQVLTHTPVDHTSYYYLYNYSGLIPSKIPDNTGFSSQHFIYISGYINGAYTYKNRYTISASARKDASNLFGVRQNQKGVPLYSVGAVWMLSQEKFYGSAFLPYLKLRMTYGYNGNVDNSLSAFTTIMYGGNAYITHGQYAEIRNPPNPNLGWEKTGIFNVGLDFRFKRNIINGSIDYYQKKGKDLIGYAPVDPTTGVMDPATSSFEYKGNVANMKGSGIDLELHSRNIDRNFKWYSTLILNYHRNEITNYYSNNDNASNYVGNELLVVNPLEGKPVYSVLSYKWGGLDSQTGDPQGYVDDKISTDYSKILYSSKVSDLVYHGPALPPLFGSLMNTFSYKNISVSFNIQYKFGYFFRRSSINYYTLFYSWKGNKDFKQRWQKPGDEKRTNVPSMIYPSNRNRSQFYNYSSALVEKGDNIRLQDISISYKLEKQHWKGLPFRELRLYSYINNVGILWRANNYDLDQDYLNTPPPTSFAFGLQVKF